jgi:hypothetical protein
MEPYLIKDLTGILTIVLIFGGGVLYLIISSVATNWRKARVAEQNAVLKRSMLEKGFSPEEIVRVIQAGEAKIE